MQSPLQQQFAMFTEIISLTGEIIEQQTLIKSKVEQLKLENEDLQMKSQDLQKVLASSQQQLHIETSIPIDLINQLATTVRDLKNEQQNGLDKLLKLLNQTCTKFNRQRELVETKNTSITKSEEAESEIKEETHKVIEVDEAWPKSNSHGSRANSRMSSMSNYVTMLETKEGSDCSPPNTASPASHSETVLTGYKSKENESSLAKINGNVTMAIGKGVE